MAIIVECGSGSSLEHRSLKTMFEDRKRVFVDLLKWDVPVLEGRYELDQFDDQHATYIVIADSEGDHLASARLLPTTRPHILGTLFTELCAAPPPTGPAIYEITRFCLSRRHPAPIRREARNRLVSALVCHALEDGIQTYTGVAELSWLQQILAFGWDCRPLGAPRPLASGTLGALAIVITDETPRLLAGNGIWDPLAEEHFRIPQAA